MLTKRLLCAVAGATISVAGFALAVNWPTATRGDDPKQQPKTDDGAKLFARENLVAWCIVPFDAKRRGPEERAAMLEKMGVKRLAYDYRAEHIPTFDAEIAALERHGIRLDAWWFPTVMNDEARLILDVLKRHKTKTQLWVMGGGVPTRTPAEQAVRVAEEAARIRPIAEAAAAIGCQVGLYNHGAWFGEPENQLAIIEKLKMPNVGIVYNLHHGHEHLDRFERVLEQMKPHLLALNINGMTRGGDQRGEKILPLGSGDLDVELLKIIRKSGYRGPIGILNHTDNDAEARLLDNLDGLDWILPQLDGKPAGERPKYRTYSPPSREALVEGRFGKALNAKRGAAIADHDAALETWPLSVECWAKLNSKTGFNILAAKNPKSSANHWELFSFAGSGHFTVYLPGYKPDHINSGIDIANGQWRHVAMTHDGKTVRLYVDGRRAAEVAVTKVGKANATGPLWVGAYDPPNIGCDGAIDEVRISDVVRRFDDDATRKSLLEKPPAADEQTLRLFRFDSERQDTKTGVRETSDDSAKKQPLRLSDFKPPDSAADKTAAGKITGHWGEDAIGFRWTEPDSIDGRWNEMDIGSWMSCSLNTPHGSTAKGMSFRLGDGHEASVCYDTATMTMRCGWTGGFIRFDPARFGLIQMPKIAGEPRFSTRPEAAWGKSRVQYRGMYAHGRRAVLHYEVGDATVHESPWIETLGNLLAVRRAIDVAPHREEIATVLCQGDRAKHEHIEGVDLVMVDDGKRNIAVTIVGGGDVVRLEATNEGAARLRFLAASKATTCRVLIAAVSPDERAAFAKLVAQSAAPEDLKAMMHGSERRWTETLVTRGALGKGDGPYVVDTLALPYDNPYKALLFTSGHDFFLNGDAAVCTIHGDVWRVRGIDERLERITWQRYATGLFQPLGLRIVGDQVYVLGRDQITRLADGNGDGEADHYECFNNAGTTSTGGHDYATCLETDRAGNFYYVRSGNLESKLGQGDSGVTRVSPDGKRHEIIATGLRNPNGLAVGPDDTITVAPQEGEWTPGSCIVQVKPGGHYGYGGPRVTPDRPLGYDPALVWIPRIIDNSSGAQAWAGDARFGPLTGQMIHFSFGRCWALLVLRDEPMPDAANHVPQAAIVKLPWNFASGAMRGRVRPNDGQLYVCGLKGWATSAGADGCFQRVRYTGAPARLPVGIAVQQNGVVLRFSTPLNRESAEDPDNYSAAAWNYHYASTYGSADYKISDPKQEGHDDVVIRSATLLADSRSVFLEIPDIRPVLQLAISMSIQAADGGAVEQDLYATINRLPERRMKPGPHSDKPRPGDLPDDVVAHLRPGLLARYAQVVDAKVSPSNVAEQVRQVRLPALAVARGEPASSMLTPGPFRARLEGYFKSPLKTQARFHFDGAGQATLRINGQEVLAAVGDLSTSIAPAVALRKGYNRIELNYESTADGTGRLRLLWSTDAFPPEAVSPTALWFDDRDVAWQSASRIDRGRELFATRNCAACHALPTGIRSPRHMPELAAETPNLGGAGERFQPAWMYAWLLKPTDMRASATMPAVFGATPDADGRQAAADIVAYLMSIADEHRELKPGAGASPATEDMTGAPRENTAAEGEQLYEDLGCVKCHTLEKPGQVDAYGRVSLYYAAAKYQRIALVEYLRAPHRRHAGTKMPDFRLTNTEAAALAAFLREEANGAIQGEEPWRTASAERGRDAFGRLGCAQCHPVGTRERLSAHRPAAFGHNAESGCMAAAPTRGKAPAFSFDKNDHAALAAFLATDGRAALQENAAESSTRLFRSLKCGQCHTRDGETTPGGLIVIEEGSGRAPELSPSLTWAGEKLRSDWTRRFLSGELPYRPRPWLHARMPVFHHYASALAAGMAAEHGVSTSNAIAPSSPPAASFADVSLAKIGEALTYKQRGLDCRLCHAPAGEVLKLTNEAQGVGLAFMADRLRDDYFYRWMLDPTRVDPAARMPKFAPDGRKTTAVQVFGGDAARQFDALWRYLNTLSPPRRAETPSGK